MKHSNNNEKYFFEIHKDYDGIFLYTTYDLFFFKLKNEEGKILLKSLQYEHKTNCRNGIKTVIRNSKNEDRFEVEHIYDEKWIVILKAGNGKRIAYSQYFDTEEEAINMIKDLKSLSLKTPVIDKTK